MEKGILKTNFIILKYFVRFTFRFHGDFKWQDP